MLAFQYILSSYLLRQILNRCHYLVTFLGIFVPCYRWRWWWW